MNKFSRDKLFQEFHRNTGIKPFSPEFIDSLVAVMRDVDSCLSERVFAWSKWRSWGNSSECAVSNWNPAEAWRLDQTDCALDLAWFQEGRPLEWVEGMTKEYRVKMRDVAHPDRPKGLRSRQRISEAFTKNADRDTITFDGQSIIPVVSPQQKNLQKFRTPRTFEKDTTFLESWKVTDTADFEQWQSAYTAYLQARNVARSAYRAYRKRGTSGGPILIDVKERLRNGSKDSLAGGRANPVVSEPPAREEPPARPPDNLRVDQEPTPKPPEIFPAPEQQPTESGWQSRLREFLATRSIPTHLDEGMFRSIANQLSEPLLEQFKTAAIEAHGIRKWSGYLGIAKQVSARGVVNSLDSGGKPETDMERRYREKIERRRQEEQVNG